MPILSSIESLDKANIIDTQNRPIIVHASDLNSYYCKYHNVGTAHRLFKEYLIACFLQCWHFDHAPTALIKVLPEHIPVDLTIPKNRFDTPCFGLEKIKDVFDLNKATEGVLTNLREKEALRAIVLKLAFFDIWTCNEDRHSNNYNLLAQSVNNKYILYPIDHEACFNSQNLERGLVSITYEDSLFYSSFFRNLFKSNKFTNRSRLEKLKQYFYLCALDCRKHINFYLQGIPQEWNVDTANKEAELNRFLLNNEWYEECWHTFLQFLENFASE